MKRYNIEQIEKLKKAEINENRDFLFYDIDGKISRQNIKFIILREGFVSSMNESFIITNIECVGFVGQSYKSTTVDMIEKRLKKMNGYYPKHHDWSKRQQM